MQAPYESSLTPDSGLKKTVIASLVIHLLVFTGFVVGSLIRPSTTVSKTPYLFDMVNVQTPYRYHAPRTTPVREVPALPKPKAAPKPAVKKEAGKNLTSKKMKEAENKPAPPEEKPQTEEAPSDAREEAALPQQNEMRLGISGVPDYFRMQLQRAIEQNWRTVPQELLGSETRLAVTISFTLQKNGQITDIQILESSWNSLLDKLAIRAVEKAKVPPIPDKIDA